MAQYADDYPSNKITVCHRRGGNLCQEIMNLLSSKKHSNTQLQWSVYYLFFDSWTRTLCAYGMIISYSAFYLLSFNKFFIKHYYYY